MCLPCVHFSEPRVLCVVCMCVSLSFLFFLLSSPPSHFPLLWAVLKRYYEPPAYNGRSYVTNSQPTADELTAIHFLSIFSHTANIPIQSQILTNCKGKLSLPHDGNPWMERPEVMVCFFVVYQCAAEV